MLRVRSMRPPPTSASCMPARCASPCCLQTTSMSTTEQQREKPDAQISEDSTSVSRDTSICTQQGSTGGRTCDSTDGLIMIKGINSTQATRHQERATHDKARKARTTSNARYIATLATSCTIASNAHQPLPSARIRRSSNCRNA